MPVVNADDFGSFLTWIYRERWGGNIWIVFWAEDMSAIPDVVSRFSNIIIFTDQVLK